MSHIHLQKRDFYTVSGRIGRLDLLVGMLCVALVIIAAHYLFISLARVVDISDIALSLVVGMQLIRLALLTPLYIKRLHDLNTSGWWVLVFWAPMPFSFEISALAKRYFGFVLNPFFHPIMLVELFGLLVLLVLLFKKGNPEVNRWGDPNHYLCEQA